MALYLVGAGVGLDLTLGGVKALRGCREAFIETYTNPFTPEALASLEKDAGRKLEPLGREKVESNFLLERAALHDVALLSSGDPLTATTHIVLVMEAKKRKIPVRVIHNSSIYTAAAGKAGLQIYRFGRTATLVNPRPNYAPKSALDVIRSNLKANMHSLVLLDTEPKPMEAGAALEMLAEFGSAVVLSRLGFDGERAVYGPVGELTGKGLGRPPFAIIIPAKLHPVEEEYLALLR